MKIQLKVDYTVCRDGIRPESFKAGDVVEMPEPIAKVLLGDRRAVAPKVDAEPEVNAEEGAPENKMEQGAPANKKKGGRK